jgi:hypothetical protein
VAAQCWLLEEDHPKNAMQGLFKVLWEWTQNWGSETLVVEATGQGACRGVSGTNSSQQKPIKGEFE